MESKSNNGDTNDMTNTSLTIYRVQTSPYVDKKHHGRSWWAVDQNGVTVKDSTRTGRKSDVEACFMATHDVSIVESRRHSGVVSAEEAERYARLRRVWD